WQVEGHAEPALPLLEQVAEALVGLGGRAEARVLAHRPEPSAVHRGLHPAGVRELAREPQVPDVVHRRGVRGRVQALDRGAARIREGYRALGGPRQRGLERPLLPLAAGLLEALLLLRRHRERLTEGCSRASWAGCCRASCAGPRGPG